MKQSHDDEVEIIARLRSGLDELDSSVLVFTPNQQWFEQLVEQQQKVSRRRLYRDLAVFLMVALVVLCGTLAALAKVPVVFLALQAAALIGGSLFLLTKEGKRVRHE